jgi:hypothetical protein
VLGAYLGKLGLSYDAIMWITEKGPDEINWLTPELARKYNIRVDNFDAFAQYDATSTDSPKGSARDSCRSKSASSSSSRFATICTSSSGR